MTSHATPTSRPDLAAVGVVMLGGGFGSVARYGVSRILHPAADGFPTGTFVINVVGSLLLGALIVAVTEIWRPHRLVRPLLGTGVLGGFTTFSTFAFEARAMSGAVAAAYVLASVVGGVSAGGLGMAIVRRLEPRIVVAAGHETVDDVDPDLP